MIYIAFDPGKTGGICVLDRSRVKLLRPMPVIKIKEKKKSWHEYDTAEIRRIVMAYPQNRAVIEMQQDRAGQRRGGDSAVGAFNLLKGICIGVGSCAIVEVHPATWTAHCYRGMVETCLSCGLTIGGEIKLVRMRTVVRQRGERAGKRDVEECRCCPECLADIDGKLRSVRYCREHFPRINLLATENCTVPHEGMVDALAIAGWAGEVGA